MRLLTLLFLGTVVGATPVSLKTAFAQQRPAVVTPAVKPAEAQPPKAEKLQPDRLALDAGARSSLTYVYGDRNAHRPYFAYLKTPSGIQVTRNHPPIKGKDSTDHADLHPGLWTAFGDLGGVDFWRGKGPRIEHERFSKAPEMIDVGKTTFAAENHYVNGDDVLAREAVRYTISPVAAGYLIVIDSTLSAEKDEIEFGDQEEMGLGVRVATAISVRDGNGKITNSHGDVNEAGTWGKQADWCDYSGTVEGKYVGITLMAHRDNPYKPWFHSRDYGVLVANSFGERAKAPRRLPLKKDKPLRMRFGVVVHESHADGFDAGKAYEAFVKDTP